MRERAQKSSGGEEEGWACLEPVELAEGLKLVGGFRDDLGGRHARLAEGLAVRGRAVRGLPR